MDYKTNDGEEGQVQLARGKPRINWNHELHELFLGAVSRLGGADKATPMLLLQEMRVDGLTLPHLKSHLQKYRLALSRVSAANKKKQGVVAPPETATDKIPHPQLNKTMMKLEERIEAQKRLQMRVEAEGKHLRSLLRKAQKVVAVYGSSTAEAGEANPAIKELVAAVEAADSGADSFLTSVYAAAEQCGSSEGSVDDLGVRKTGRELFVREEIDLNK